MTDTPKTPNDWILSDDTGMSSKTIWAVMMANGVDRIGVRYAMKS